MAARFKRLSTEYVASEDRIRIVGELDDAQSIVIWMTNRMASRVVPALLQWLAKQASPSVAASAVEGRVMQSFAQEAAVAALKPQPPVTPHADSSAWLMQAVDFQPTEGHIGLTFRGRQGESASVRFKASELRQWLSILHLAWSKAQWPSLLWPDWIKRENPTQQQMVIH
ncbi:MAG: hypothetical protein E6G95_05305 [Alphaproteobacteria bacterium]|nr:MAG: hypothetical protein E6G95_05305 [Alphaproteobacteria bacterium]